MGPLENDFLRMTPRSEEGPSYIVAALGGNVHIFAAVYMLRRHMKPALLTPVTAGRVCRCG
jgi:hypothetical protein